MGPAASVALQWALEASSMQKNKQNIGYRVTFPVPSACIGTICRLSYALFISLIHRKKNVGANLFFQPFSSAVNSVHFLLIQSWRKPPSSHCSGDLCGEKVTHVLYANSVFFPKSVFCLSVSSPGLPWWGIISLDAQKLIVIGDEEAGRNGRVLGSFQELQEVCKELPQDIL